MSDTYATGPMRAEMQNTSGQGPAFEAPAGIGRLNWGAFAFSWIWGLGNRTYIALLALLPPLNLVMPFVLLFKGDKWAWQNDRWRDLEHFRTVQKHWAIAAAVVYGLGAAFFVGIFVVAFAVLASLEPVETAKHEARTNPRIAEHVGTPVDVSWWFTGSVNTEARAGDADVTVYLSGPLASGTLRMVSVKRGDAWVVRKIVLTLDDTGQVIGLSPPSN